MDIELAVWVVTSLYVGAGRKAGEAEERVWAKALEDVPDDAKMAEWAVTAMLREVDFGLRPPTPALFLEYRRRWVRARRDEAEGRAEIETGEVGDGLAQIARLRRMLAEAPPVTKAVPS